MDSLIRAEEKDCTYSLHRVSRFIEPSLLLFLLKEPSYGYELIESLETLGFNLHSVDAGAVYRTLRKLAKEGFVESFWEKGKSKRKKRYYKITSHGLRLLNKWIDRIEERKQALDRFLSIAKNNLDKKKP